MVPVATSAIYYTLASPHHPTHPMGLNKISPMSIYHTVGIAILFRSRKACLAFSDHTRLVFSLIVVVAIAQPNSEVPNATSDYFTVPTPIYCNGILHNYLSRTNSGIHSMYTKCWLTVSPSSARPARWALMAAKSAAEMGHSSGNYSASFAYCGISSFPQAQST